MITDNMEMINMFIVESIEHLNRIEPDLIKIEQNPEDPDPEIINRIFRSVHSIKGSSGFIGLEKIGKLSHVMEHLLVEVRDGTMTAGKYLIDALLQGLDKLKLMIDDTMESESYSIEEEIKSLKKLFNEEENTSDTEESRVIFVDDNFEFNFPEEIKNTVKSHGKFLYILELNLAKEFPCPSTGHETFFDNFQTFGTIIDSKLISSHITGIENCLEDELILKIFFHSIMELDLISLALEYPEEYFIEVKMEKTENISAKKTVSKKEKIKISKKKPEEPLKEIKKLKTDDSSKKIIAKGDDTLRVKVNLLNDLMNLASEMVLSRNQLLTMNDIINNTNTRTQTLLHNINYITSELQEKIMHTRMQPVSIVFNKFHRIVRDLSKNLGKEIDLVITGNEVELDKSIIENLSDPMIHLIRNSIDHGIENSETRKRMDKNPIGKIKIEAYHESGRVNIDITDDGKGIDPEKIKASALKKGIISTTEIESMTPQNIIMLIFQAGFSTTEEVSEISGRGVGMDVVKNNIENLGGTIQLSSVPGAGTKIKLKLPLTLAIIPSLIISIADRKFAIPQVSIKEMVRIKKEDTKRKIEIAHGAPVLRLRDRLLPIIKLNEVLKIKNEFYDTALEETKIDRRKALTDLRELDDNQVLNSDLTERRTKIDENVVRILVLNVNDNYFGLVVDKINNNEEIVVKPLPRFMKNIQAYAGTTILGDGSVSLILDVTGISKMMNLKFSSIEKSIKETELELLENRELQNLLIFENAKDEFFAFNLDQVQRVEKIKFKDLELIGDKIYLKHQGESLKIIKLSDHLPVNKCEKYNDFVFVIIPKLIGYPLGILVNNILDSQIHDVDMNTENFSGKGILGSAIINNRIVIFPDIFSLAESADPELYKKYSYNSKKIKYNKTIRCLLAEDTPFFRKIITNYLEGFGFHVDTVKDGLHARNILDKHHENYDLIISDINMPRMDGFGLIKWIREDKRLNNKPVMALTSLKSDKDREAGIKAGFNAFEIKLDKDRLINRINELMNEYVIAEE